MDRQLMVDKYVERFPDSPLAKMKEESGFFDNRLKDVPCPKCGRFETVKVTRAGYVKGFCRKCFNEFDLNFKEAHAEVVNMVQEQEEKNTEFQYSKLADTLYQELMKLDPVPKLIATNKCLKILKDTGQVPHTWEFGISDIRKVFRQMEKKGYCRKPDNSGQKTAVRLLLVDGKEVQAVKVKPDPKEANQESTEKTSEEETQKVEETAPEVQTRKRRPFDEELFKKLLNEGKSNLEIAAEMKTSTSVIYLHKKDLGLLQYNLKGEKEKQEPNLSAKGNGTREGRPIPEKFRELYAQGKTDKEIAAELGVSHSTPWNWRKRLGLAANNNPKDYNKNQRPSPENTGKEIVSALDKNIPFGYYLEIAERFVSFLEISHRASFLKFQELELAKGTSREDIDKALEIGFRMHKLGVLH